MWRLPLSSSYSISGVMSRQRWIRYCICQTAQHLQQALLVLTVADTDQMVQYTASDIQLPLSAAIYLFLIPLSLPSPFTWPRAGGCSVTSMRDNSEA